MWRSLLHYRQLAIAVMLGVAVASSVLSGALTVGDSVRMSLRNLMLGRLGQIEHAVIPEHYVSEGLVKSLNESESLQAHGVIMLNGGAESGGATASNVQITGVRDGFGLLFEDDGVSFQQPLQDALKRESGQVFPSAVLNEALARELSVKEGDELVLSFENTSDIHRDSLYGRKNSEDVIKKLRVTVRLILPENGLGRFGLNATQNTPLNVFVPLRNLQQTLDSRRKINAIFLAAGETELPLDEAKAKIRNQITLDDLNFNIRQADDYFSVESPSFFLKQKLVEDVEALAKKQSLSTFPVSTYLVNRIEAGDKLTPYSLICAADFSNAMAGATLQAGALELADDEVLLTAWTAEDLGVEPGGEIKLAWYGVGAEEDLIEESARFKVAGILDMEGLAVDRDLAPDFPGVKDADNMSDWDPPFDMDMSLIRTKDEVFWDDYRTAPKIMVNQTMGKQMWDSRFGFYTGMRMAYPEGGDPREIIAEFEKQLLAGLTLESGGIPVIDLRKRGLEASEGATDFGQLFVALSFFIIISAALLVGLFFRLSTEQRQAEVGVMLAMGYTIKQVRKRFLSEGMLLAVIGALLGIAGGYLYGSVMMYGLRNWWSLGSSQLFFHYNPVSPTIGFVSALVISWLSIRTTVKKIGKVEITVLVKGGDLIPEQKETKNARRVFWISTVLGLLTLGYGLMANLMATLGAGAFFVTAGLSGLAMRMSAQDNSNSRIRGLWSMASRNLSRQRGQSLISVSLVASACFIITILSLSKHTGAEDPDILTSGTGGSLHDAQSPVPLPRRFSESANQEYGFDENLIEMLDQTEVAFMRLRGGDDASCLNLFAPQEPRILGLPDDHKLDGRFSFQSHIGDDSGSPWGLLDQTFEDGAIPAIADANSAMWILKTGLGKDFIVKDENGEDVKLRLVGLLNKSVFQSELIVSEANFQTIYPGISGFGYLLLDSEHPERKNLAAGLETALAEYAIDASYTEDKLKQFHEVENTYISIFQVLGGLGLLLGTLGLGALIYRNAMARKGEFAAMRAFGYQSGRISRLLITENTVIMLLGMGIGAFSALVSVLPHLFQSRTEPSILLLVITLAGVFVIGMLSSLWAVGKTHNLPILASLRSGG